MLNVNDHKNFTATGDMEAEMLLKRVLSEIGETLSGTGLCVVLGGSYGRGDGGVRLDRENGILYNDLDFFVFINFTFARHLKSLSVINLSIMASAFQIMLRYLPYSKIIKHFDLFFCK